MRIGFLIFSFGFDFVVHLVSRCLSFALTFMVVTLLTSRYVRVLATVCYPDVSGCPTFDQHICLRTCVGVLPWPSSHRFSWLHIRNQAKIFVVVPSSCLCRFRLPLFRNLAQTCRVFVSSRLFCVLVIAAVCIGRAAVDHLIGQFEY